MKPFRWDISRREQLGRLTEGPTVETYDTFYPDLRTCAARVFASSRDSDLVFVGRSPDSIFDYLSGALSPTSWSDRLQSLNVSIRYADNDSLRKEAPRQLEALKKHLTELSLDPYSLARRGPVSFVDLVCEGWTFENLASVIVDWVQMDSPDPPAALRNIRFIGITQRQKTSPNTFRWHQHAPWLRHFPRGAVRNVSVPRDFWDYLGNEQPKTTPSNSPTRWGADDLQVPPRWENNLDGLRLAVAVFDRATSRDERLLFSNELSSLAEMSLDWVRATVAELRGTSRSS